MDAVRGLHFEKCIPVVDLFNFVVTQYSMFLCNGEFQLGLGGEKCGLVFNSLQKKYIHKISEFFFFGQLHYFN